MALTQTQVSELYVTIFGRPPEKGGSLFWSSLEFDANTIANGMLNDGSATDYFGSSLDSNQAFIEHIYLNTFNRTIDDDPAGIAYWTSLLDTNFSRGEVVNGIIAAIKTEPAESPSLQQFQNRVEVANYYANNIEVALTESFFDSTGLNVTSDPASVDAAIATIDSFFDVSAPTITISNIDISDDTGSSDSDFLTNTASQTVTATLSDALTTTASIYTSAETLMGSVDGGNTFTDITSFVSGTTLTWTGVTLAGTSSIQLKVVDGAGLEGTTAIQNYELDTTAPTATITLDSDITADDIINAAEAAASVVITGSVGGDVQDGDIVTVTVNGTDYTGPVTSGAFSIEVQGIDLAADTQVAASVTTSDDAGNTTTATDTEDYSVDTSATASITLDTITADSIINAAEAAASVVITGSVGGDVQDGDIVTVTVNGTDYTGTVTSGAFSIEVQGSDLAADTQVSASVTTTDDAGNTATASDTEDYSVDTTISASITLDSDITADDIINAAEAAASVAITGSVGGDVQDGDIVTVTVNGTDYTGPVTSGAFSIEVQGSDLAQDTQVTASVSTTDDAGNSATASDTEDYSVDTTVSANITLDSDITADDIINAAEAAASVVITGSVGGDVQDGDIVTVTVNGTDYTGSVTSSAFSIEVQGSDLAADTQVAASVTTTDDAGNTASASDTESYTVDTSATASITLDQNITADDIINAAEAASTIAITGTVGGDVQNGDTVTVTVNGVSSTGSVANGAFSVSVAGSNLASATSVTASVTTTNSAGNSATATDTETYSVDTTAPFASISLDADITADDTIDASESTQTIAITGTTSGDTQDGDTVTVTVNGVDYTGTTSGNTFSVDVAGSDLAQDTTITATLTATDAAGNSRTAIDREIYSVDINATASIALDQSITADDIISAAEATQTIAITGTVGGDVQDSDTITVTVNGTDYTGTSTAGAFSIDVAGSELAQATSVTASVSTSNSAGQTATATDTATYQVDTSISASITLDANITADDVIDSIEATQTIAITGQVGGDVQDGDTVTVTVNGTDYTGSVVSGAFSVNVAGSDLAADTQVLASVTTTDSVGNTATAQDSESYTVNTSSLQVSINFIGGIASDNIINVQEAALSSMIIPGEVDGDVEDGDTVTVSVNGNDYNATVASNQFTVTIPMSDLLADTQITASIDITDGVNNASDSTTVEYEVDTTLPVVTDTTAGNIFTSESFTVASSEESTIYAVHSDVDVNNANSLLTAPDHLSNTVVITGPGAVPLSASGLQAGTYTLFAIDEAGNLSAPVATVDVLAPTTAITGVDIAEDTGDSDSDFITNVAAQTITATLSDPLKSKESLMGSLDNGVTWVDITDKVTGTAISWDGATLAGESSIVLKVVDDANNEGPETSQAYELDTVTPTATLHLSEELITSNVITLDPSGSGDSNQQMTKFGDRGDFVVVWESVNDSGDSDIYVRVLDNEGNTVVSDTVLSGTTDEDDVLPQITSINNDGSFVVSWTGGDGELAGDDTSIHLQRFDGEGAKVGSVIHLEPTGVTDGNDSDVQTIALGDNGAFAVTWEGVDSSGDDSIFVQRFDTEGSPDGAQVQLEPTGNDSGDDANPQITALGDDGAFAVTWTGPDASGDSSVFVQHFDSNGNVVGAPIDLDGSDTESEPDSQPQIIALGTNGDSVVVWSGDDGESGGDDRSIYVQRFDSDGNEDGAKVQIEPTGITDEDDQHPQITTLGANGAFAVTWFSDDGEDASIFVQRFDTEGNPDGEPDVLGSPGRENLNPKIISLNDDGDYAVVWHHEDDGPNDVWLQRFYAEGYAMDEDPIEIKRSLGSNENDTDPQIIALANNDFAVSWVNQDSGSGSSTRDISVQTFDSMSKSVIQTDESFIVESTEPSTAYVVHSSVTVNSLTDITGAAGNLWNSIALEEDSLIRQLPATGLDEGDYRLYVVDAAGNLSAPSTNTIEVEVPVVDTSVVVFDLINGESSSHSGRIFDINTTYTIYIQVDSDSASMEQPTPWTGAGALGPDDTIILVGDGTPIVQRQGTTFFSGVTTSTYSTPIHSYTKDPSEMQWRASGSAGVSLTKAGELNRTIYTTNYTSYITSFTINSSTTSFSTLTVTSSYSSVVLWNTSAIGPNNGRTFNQVYLQTMPAGVLTSQGLV